MNQETFIRKMKAIHKAIADGKDSIDTIEAIMVLASTLGYVLAQGLDDEADLESVYGRLISDIDTARQSSLAYGVTMDAIGRAKQ